MFKFRCLETAQTLFLKVFIHMLNFRDLNSFMSTESTEAEWSASWESRVQSTQADRTNGKEKKPEHVQKKKRFKYVHTYIHTHIYVCIHVHVYAYACMHT